MMIYHVNRTGKFMKQFRENERRAYEAVGKFCVGKMNYYVPVDTGYLKSRNEYVIAKSELYLQNDCFYAKFQEFGTYKMKAQPFIRPSVLNHKSEIGRIIAEEMGKGM